MSALSHQREVGGPINSIISFLTDNSRIFYYFWNYFQYFQYSIHGSQSPKSYRDYSRRLFLTEFYQPLHHDEWLSTDS